MSISVFHETNRVRILKSNGIFCVILYLDAFYLSRIAEMKATHTFLISSASTMDFVGSLLAEHNTEEDTDINCRGREPSSLISSSSNHRSPRILPPRRLLACRVVPLRDTHGRDRSTSKRHENAQRHRQLSSR
jgi:hypothetical protein